MVWFLRDHRKLAHAGEFWPNASSLKTFQVGGANSQKNILRTENRSCTVPGLGESAGPRGPPKEGAGLALLALRIMVMS